MRQKYQQISIVRKKTKCTKFQMNLQLERYTLNSSNKMIVSLKVTVFPWIHNLLVFCMDHQHLNVLLRSFVIAAMIVQSSTYHGVWYISKSNIFKMNYFTRPLRTYTITMHRNLMKKEQQQQKNRWDMLLYYNLIIMLIEH